MISFASVEDAGIQHILFLLLYCYCGSNTQAYWAFLLYVVKTTFQCFIYKRSQQHVLHVRQSLYIDPLLNTTQNGFLSPLGIEPVIFLFVRRKLPILESLQAHWTCHPNWSQRTVAWMFCPRGKHDGDILGNTKQEDIFILIIMCNNSCTEVICRKHTVNWKLWKYSNQLGLTYCRKLNMNGIISQTQHLYAILLTT